MLKNVLFILACCVFASCSTGYQSRGLLGGYNHNTLSPRIYEVRFSGNGFTSKQKAKDFTLLRSAEVILEGGYSYFTIVEKADETSVNAYTSPGWSDTEIKRTGLGKYEVETNHYGGETSYTTLPAYSYTIRGYKTSPNNYSGIVYDARFVQRSIRTKYELGLPGEGV